jgi:hypothetical protein
MSIGCLLPVGSCQWEPNRCRLSISCRTVVSGQWSVVSGTERLPVVSGTVSGFLRSALTGFLPSRRWRQWSLRILRKESSLAKDHENEDDPKFRGANDPPTTDNRQLRYEQPTDN